RRDRSPLVDGDVSAVHRATEERARRYLGIGTWRCSDLRQPGEEVEVRRGRPPRHEQLERPGFESIVDAVDEVLVETAADFFESPLLRNDEPHRQFTPRVRDLRAHESVPLAAAVG